MRAKITQRKDKSGLTLRLSMTRSEMEEFIIERGEQPEGMIRIMVREVKE